MEMSFPPTKLTHVLETCLYVKSMPKSQAFYEDILGLIPSLKSERITVFPLMNTTLLLFQLGLTHDDIHPEDHPEHTIPGHGPTQSIIDAIQSDDGSQQRLKQHFCLAVPSRQDIEKVGKPLEDQRCEDIGGDGLGKGRKKRLFRGS